MSAGVVHESTAGFPMPGMWNAMLVGHKGEVLVICPAGVNYLAPHWRWWCGPNARPTDWVAITVDHYYANARYRGLGFSFNPAPLQTASIPAWFPTLLAGLVLGFVWRNTGRKSARRAFPVEPTSAQGEPPA